MQGTRKCPQSVITAILDWWKVQGANPRGSFLFQLHSRLHRFHSTTVNFDIPQRTVLHMHRFHKDSPVISVTTECADGTVSSNPASSACLRRPDDDLGPEIQYRIAYVHGNAKTQRLLYCRMHRRIEPRATSDVDPSAPDLRVDELD